MNGILKQLSVLYEESAKTMTKMEFRKQVFENLQNGYETLLELFFNEDEELDIDLFRDAMELHPDVSTAIYYLIMGYE